MKYKLLQALPWYWIWYIIDTDDITQVKFLQNPEKFPDFFEEVKEPKTIYDLKEGDEYYLLDSILTIWKYIVTDEWNWYNNAHINNFCTEREAKRNKLLRELATREKFLPEEYTKYIDFQWIKREWYGEEHSMFHYHTWLIFRNEEEYNKYMTDEAKDLLFNL
jgi:hypothetical protein